MHYLVGIYGPVIAVGAVGVSAARVDMFGVAVVADQSPCRTRGFGRDADPERDAVALGGPDHAVARSGPDPALRPIRLDRFDDAATRACQGLTRPNDPMSSCSPIDIGRQAHRISSAEPATAGLRPRAVISAPSAHHRTGAVVVAVGGPKPRRGASSRRPENWTPGSDSLGNPGTGRSGTAPTGASAGHSPQWMCLCISRSPRPARGRARTSGSAPAAAHRCRSRNRLPPKRHNRPDGPAGPRRARRPRWR